MENIQVFLGLLGSGGILSIFGILIARYYQRKDKRTDRKSIAYTTSLKKIDEIKKGVRNNPNVILDSLKEFGEIALKDLSEEEINNALIHFLEKMFDVIKKAIEPQTIINNELNELLVVCSDEISLKIKELNQLTIDFNNDLQKTLALISPNDSNSFIAHLTTLGHDERYAKIETLTNEILQLMRKELK